jgi:FkbM family methyltransferase
MTNYLNLTKLRWYVGSSFNSVLHKLLSNQLFPLTRYFPYGRSVYYDIQRFSQNKNLNILFDIGANVGQTANGLIKYFPKSKIYCFEPVDKTFAILSENLHRYTNVNCIQKGMGRVSGSVNIILHDDSELNTIVSNGPRENQKIGEEEIILDTVDGFTKSQNITHIDFLKIDVQGWEMEVLMGAEALLRDKKIRFIYTEVGFRRSDRDMQHFSEINDFLEDKGFWLCGFYDQFRWGEHKQYLGFANALYVQPNFSND